MYWYFVNNYWELLNMPVTERYNQCLKTAKNISPFGRKTHYILRMHENNVIFPFFSKTFSFRNFKKLNIFIT